MLGREVDNMIRFHYLLYLNRWKLHMENHPRISFLMKYQNLLLIAAGCLTVALTLNDYGISWDETPLSIYGELVYRYFESGFKDTRCNTYVDSKYYGPLFELLTILPYKIFNGFRYEFRHLFIAITAMAAVVGTAKFAGLFKNSTMALFSPLFLVLMPRFYGHAFFNSKDIPFACAFVWAMYAIGKLTTEKIRPQLSVFTGVMIGLAMSIRVGGVLLLFFFAAIAAYSLSKKEPGTEFRDRILNWLLTGTVVLSIAWIIMISCWPWAHESPILNPLKALKMFSSFHAVYPVLFEGVSIPSNRLPWYYLLKYILITTPPLIIFLAILGMLRGGYLLCKLNEKDKNTLHFSVLLWFFFPIIYTMVRRPNIYDGVRHFLFIFPPLAVYASMGAALIISLVKTRFKPAAVIVLLGLSITLLGNHVALHPYQMTYFNSFAGGLETAATRYETEYWTTSYKEAAEWINRESESSTRAPVVLIAGNGYNRISFEYFLHPRIRTEIIFTNTKEQYLPVNIDYYVATTRYGLHKNFPKETLSHTIGKKGAVFTVIKKRNPTRNES